MTHIPKTAHDREMVVLASMIAPETRRAALNAMKYARFDPELHFSDPDARAQFTAYRMDADNFGDYLDGAPLSALATPYIEGHLAAILADYRQRLSEMDRTLDSFETPGPDTDDPECLFQNRWLRRGMCGAIVSTSGVGKSSFSMQAAAMWAAGVECLGVRPLRPLKIGIFQAEDDEYDVANFRDRIRIGLVQVLGWDEERIRDAESRVTFCAIDGSSGARFIEHVRRKQEKHHFDIIIINPLFAFFGGDLNDGAAVTEFLRHGIDPLIKTEATKCACLIVHHTGKPNKEAMQQGDVFKAYLGSGSSEFTNYIRSALVITPFDNGRVAGTFELIGAKHGDKLGWRDGDGRPTVKKTVCYANRLEEYQDTGMIFWIEPDADQLAELTDSAPQVTTPAPKRPPIDACAEALARAIRDNWADGVKPAAASHGQKEWVAKIPGTGFSRTVRMDAYALLMSAPDRYGLSFTESARGGGYLVPNTETEVY